MTVGSGVCAQKNASRTRWVRSDRGVDWFVADAVAAGHQCSIRLRNSLLVARSRPAPAPRGGVDATSTPAGASFDSKYFCTTKPPIEWPTTTGGAARPSATDDTSST